MFRDVLILLWAEGKRLKGDLVYWIKLLGYDPTSSVMYRVYFFLFWAFWLVTAWSTAVQQIYPVSQSLTREAITSLLGLVPNGVLALQVLYFAQLLRDPPLKLSSPDMTHVAASPVQRGALALAQFLHRLLVPALVVSLGGSLLSMLLSWQSQPEQVGYIGLNALLLPFPLVYATAGLGWALALLKQRPMSRLQRLAFWPLLALLSLVAKLIPSVGLWMGNLWVQIVQNAAPVEAVLVVIVLLVVALLLIAVAGGRVHLAIVADSSMVYARLQRLGMFGRFYAADVIARIHRQAKLLKKKRLRLGMATKLEGHGALLSRSTLSLLRLSPATIVRPLLRGASLALGVSLLVSVGGWESLAIWLLVVLMAIVNRPVEIAAPFRETTTLPFVRQFLPADSLEVFAISAFYPFLLTSIGALLVMTAMGLGHPLVVLLALLTIFAMGLAQALESLEGRGIFGRSIPYPYTIVIYAVIVIIAGLASQSIMIALGAAAATDFVLGLMVRG